MKIKLPATTYDKPFRITCQSRKFGNQWVLTTADGTVVTQGGVWDMCHEVRKINARLAGAAERSDNVAA